MTCLFWVEVEEDCNGVEVSIFLNLFLVCICENFHINFFLMSKLFRCLLLDVGGVASGGGGGMRTGRGAR